MASIQEIHHLPVQGQDFNIQGGQCSQPTNPPAFKHKPHKKCVPCEPVWKHKPLKKWCKHKLHKVECSSSSSHSSLSSSSSNDSCLNSSSESDSCLNSSSESDSCLSSSSESDCGPETQPICKHKPHRECPVPVKCFESKHKLKKGKYNFVPGKTPKLDWKHKSKHFECTADLECKFKPQKTGACIGNIQDCLVCEGPSFPTNECLHHEGNVHNWFDCEDRFRRCLICKQEFTNLTCECLEHSHFGLCALRIFLTRSCGFFGCHRLWSKPWSKPGPDPCQTSQPTKF